MNHKKKQLLIIPGWEGSKETWKNFINLAQNDFEVYCFDLPCFGNEPCPDKVWGVEDYSAFVVQKIKNLNLNKPILLGHSFGGQIAAYLAANNPEATSKLILSGPAIFRQPNNFKKIIFNFVAIFGKFFFQLPIACKFAIKAKKILYRLANSDYNNTSGIKREVFKKVTRQDVSQIIKQINLPTLVIWGNKDKYLPVKHGKKIIKLIPNSKLKIIKNGGHGLHINQLSIFYKIIKDFLN